MLSLTSMMAAMLPAAQQRFVEYKAWLWQGLYNKTVIRIEGQGPVESLRWSFGETGLKKCCVPLVVLVL